MRIYLWNLSFIQPTRIYPRFVNWRVKDNIPRTQKNFDLVICESPQMFLSAQDIASDHNAKLLLNKHNSYYKLVEGYLNNNHSRIPMAGEIVKNVKEFERFCVTESDIAIFQSDNDLELFSDVLPPEYGVIPNGTNFNEINSGRKKKGREILNLPFNKFICIFVGSYDYLPNEKAAEFIAKNVAPELPEVDFVLVGRQPPSFDLENIHTPGYVENYADVLSAADAALCPLLVGSGTKLKMLDYLSAGLPIITTPVGAQGLPINKSNALISKTPREFREAIMKLRDNRRLINQLSEKSENLGEQYSWDNLLSEYYEYI